MRSETRSAEVSVLPGLPPAEGQPRRSELGEARETWDTWEMDGGPVRTYENLLLII